MIFAASAAALVLAAAIGVAAGSLVAQHVSSKVLSYVAGGGFIAIGIWTMVTAGGD
jgi:putative Ca2+/H+ antiporter (TMEM165/GDT1 family)